MNKPYESRYFTRTPKLPEGYLSGGYFSEKNYIRRELIGETAQEVAKALAVGRPELTSSQFRRFFDYAKIIEQRLKLLNNWAAVAGDVEKLRAFAAEAKGKRKVPEIFYEFISANVSAITDADSFCKGFIEHMQAVLAYFTYDKPKR